MNLPIAPKGSCGVGKSRVPPCGGPGGAASDGAVMTTGGSAGGGFAASANADAGANNNAPIDATAERNGRTAIIAGCWCAGPVAEMRSRAQIPHREVEEDDKGRRDSCEQPE